MITDSVSKSICEFVKLRPRAMQEIAQHIKKNWRTAERYVDKIEKETGQLSTRIFREGTRGALKVVYWNSNDDIHSSGFQQDMFDEIMRAKSKREFSPFEVYQHVPSKHKHAHIEDVSSIDPEKEVTETQNLVGFLNEAKSQILVFSGNLSWINAQQGDKKIIDVLRNLAKKGISIKVICRVSLIGFDNVKKLQMINKELGKEVIEIRHRYQPLRGILIDKKMIKMREIKDPEYYPENELDRTIEIFYDIHDKDWTVWLEKVFWKMFASAMPADKRIKEIEQIRNIVIK